jgi:hypothetical protein
VIQVRFATKSETGQIYLGKSKDVLNNPAEIRKQRMKNGRLQYQQIGAGISCIRPTNPEDLFNITW